MSQPRSRQDFALYLDEIPQFFFFFGRGFVLLFIPGLFSVLERFVMMKGFGFESMTTVECKQKITD